MKSRIDLAEKVDNREFRFGQALEYYPVTIITGLRRRPALFTPAQISEAIRRAEGNPEDIPKPTIWERLRDWLTAR